MRTHRETAHDIAVRIGAIEFGTPFTIYPHGIVSTEAHPELYAPEVVHDDEADVVLMGRGWTPLTGHTGQYGYSGAVMHPSEYVGDKLAGALWEEAHDAGAGVTFALVVVDVLPTDDDPDPEPAGWAIVRYDGEA